MVTNGHNVSPKAPATEVGNLNKPNGTVPSMSVASETDPRNVSSIASFQLRSNKLMEGTQRELSRSLLFQIVNFQDS